MFEITLGNNPGSADWLPTAAVAEVEGGITELWEGREITLDGSASASGPWGSNLVYAWSKFGPLPVEYGDASAARTTATLTDTGGAGGPFHYTLSVSGRGTGIRDASTATLPLTVVSQPTITGVAFTSTPRAGSARFSTYYLGEPIEVTVTFSAPVTVTGVPSLQIQLFDDDDMIDDRRRADYVRTVDGNRLVFAYEVQAADDSGEDIAVCGTGDHASCESRLHLPAGAAIHAGDGVVPARLGFAGLEPGSHTYGVYGATAAPTGGICERTPQIRDEIVTVLVDYGWTGVSDCGDVTPEVIDAACEEVSFDFSDKGITALKAGDFEGFNSSECEVDLSGNALTSISADVLPASVYQIDLSDNDLTRIPAGIFPQIVELEYIYLEGNRIETIAPDAFAGMSGLRLLRLRDNRLSTLPDGVFEDLTGASTIDLTDNPGSAGFKPVPVIAEEIGESFFAKQPVTRSASVTGPWGSNVSYAWEQDSASTPMVTLTGANTPTVSFEAPESDSNKTLQFNLTVTGRGGSGHSASTFNQLNVYRSPRPTSGEVTSRPRTTTGSNANTYGKDERIEITLTYSEPMVVTGTPHIRIRPGVGSSANRNALYDRHASPTQLVFSYTVASSDDVNGGFTVPSGNIVVGSNEAIENVYGAAANNTRPTIGGPKHDVDGSFTAPKGGICERSGPIGLALTAMVKANDSAVASCADVTAAHLAALTGTLTAEVGAIEPGDLAGLGSLTGLDLSGGDLVALPAGVFDRLVRLETLRLDDNDLAVLPDGIFETLTALDDLRLGGNRGSSGFGPAARAASEADAATGGQTLRLDGTGSATGPWGANVTWSWERVDAQDNVATPSWLVGADTARPSVTVPHDLIADRARFRLTVKRARRRPRSGQRGAHLDRHRGGGHPVEPGGGDGGGRLASARGRHLRSRRDDRGGARLHRAGDGDGHARDRAAAGRRAERRGARGGLCARVGRAAPGVRLHGRCGRPGHGRDQELQRGPRDAEPLPGGGAARCGRVGERRRRRGRGARPCGVCGAGGAQGRRDAGAAHRRRSAPAPRRCARRSWRRRARRPARTWTRRRSPGSGGRSTSRARGSRRWRPAISTGSPGSPASTSRTTGSRCCRREASTASIRWSRSTSRATASGMRRPRSGAWRPLPRSRSSICRTTGSRRCRRARSGSPPTRSR